jgi:folate-binding protein YgfZ
VSEPSSPDPGAAGSHDSRPAGYDDLVEDAGLFLDAGRRVWRIDGDRSLRALQGLLTADLVGPDPGSVVPSFVLTPKGRPIALLDVLKAEDHILLDLPVEAAAPLAAHFGRYLPPRFARRTELAGVHQIRLLGPRARHAVRDALEMDEVPPADRFERFPLPDGNGTVLLAGRATTAGGGWSVYAEGAALEASMRRLERAVSALGGGPVSGEAFETWRIERGIPRFGADITDENLPQETGWVDRTVSFEKGCYTGQEVVARIHYRGHVNRHLRGLRLVGASADPAFAVGAPLFHEGRRAGVVTSRADSPRLGPIGLGYVRREVEPGARVALHGEGEANVEVHTVPFTYK